MMIDMEKIGIIADPRSDVLILASNLRTGGPNGLFSMPIVICDAISHH
jgi:hypothetical protein